jgi:hypothetical protein
MTTTGQSTNPPSRKFWATKPFLISMAVVLLGGGLWVVLKDSTSLSFSFLLDGKPLPVGTAPNVELDGRPFTSGLTVTPGPHKLTADLQNAEPIEQRVWVFYGDKDLGSLTLVSSKGSLLVTVTPSPASVTVRQGLEVMGSGNAPLTVENLIPGSYELEIKHGEYEETSSVEIQGRHRTEKKIDLNLGSANLSSDPADAEFELSGNGRQWAGKLPTQIEDVPGGDYLFTARRKGWEVNATFSVARGEAQANKIEFPYGSIDVSGDPAGLAVALNGVAAGKTPITLRELKPGPYTLTATDGENELNATITVGPREQARHSFAFRYGAVQLTSTPTGATVIRKGKEIGTTPLTLTHLAVDVSGVVELRLNGYAPAVDFALNVAEGVTTNLNAKLFSEQYLQAMKHAHEAFDAAQFSESQKFLAAALESEPNDSAALTLQGEVSKAEEALRAKQAAARAREIDTLPWLDFDKVINDCTDAKEVQYSVQLADGYYQDYIDENGKKRTRFVQTGSHTEMRTRTDYIFNLGKFSANYQGRTFRFNCPDNWRVLKVESDGSIILKAGGMGSAEIKVTAATSYPDALKSLQKGQKVAIKGVLTQYDAGGFFHPRTIYLEDAEILSE